MLTTILASGRRCVAEMSENAAINEHRRLIKAYVKELGTRNTLDHDAQKEKNESESSLESKFLVRHLSTLSTSDTLYVFCIPSMSTRSL